MMSRIFLLAVSISSLIMPKILFCNSSMKVIPGIEVNEADSPSEVNDLPIRTLMASLQIFQIGLCSSNSVWPIEVSIVTRF